ncbi:MAG: hypothetical protein ACPLKQ_05330 [Candidatus Bathyarchaeales archaeon]
MDNLISGKDLAKFLYCSSLLEEKIAKAYEHVAKLADDRLVGCLLGFIARDSFKHAECFRAVGEWLSGGFQVCFSECEEVWGESWKTLVMDAEKILGKSEINSKELASLINGLMKLESFVAEEYLTALHVKLVELMTDEAKINLSHFKAVFEWIIEDERRHEQILKIIEDLLAKRVN